MIDPIPALTFIALAGNAVMFIHHCARFMRERESINAYLMALHAYALGIVAAAIGAK
jgi:hypothetical protein